MSRPGRLVAAARQREPQVERAHVAHEGAVLVPGARDAGLGLAQGRLLRPRSAAARRGSRSTSSGRPAPREHLEHLEGQQRRVRGEHAAALLDPRALADAAGSGRRARTPRSSPRPPRRRGRARARRTRGRSGRRSSSARVAVHEPADEQAAVAQDARAQQLGREVGAGDLRQVLGSGRSAVGRGGARRAARSAVAGLGRSAASRPGGAAAAAAVDSRSAPVRGSLRRQPLDLGEAAPPAPPRGRGHAAPCA